MTSKIRIFGKYDKFIVVFTYLFMLVMNALANIIPINNISTGAVSDGYANLFAPTGLTFAIWGVIYLALGAHVIYQFKEVYYSPETRVMLQGVRLWFSASSFVNGLWILAWHYDAIALSLVLMLMLLFCLVRITHLIHSAKLTSNERLWIQRPFSIYLGWILVATIANVTTLLVKWRWTAFGMREDVTTAIVIVVGLMITALVVNRFKDCLIGLTVEWAYLGILIKHVGKRGFGMAYPLVTWTTMVCMTLLMGLIIFVGYGKIRAIIKKFSK